MVDYSVSCDGAVADDKGGIYSLAVYTNGEGFNSYVYYSTDVSKGVDNKNIELLDKQVCFTSIWASKKNLLFVSDADGKVHHYNGKTWSQKKVSSDALINIWGLSDSEVFSVGDAGIVYFWNGENWTAISPPLGVTLFSIHGTSLKNLYTCGGNGSLFHFDGNNWNKITLSTTNLLQGVFVDSNEEIFVCGKGGTLFKGEQSDWTQIQINQPEVDLFSLTKFRDQIFIAGGASGIFTLNENILESLKLLACYRLDANQNFLASAGGQLAARFDGQLWFGTRYD